MAGQAPRPTGPTRSTPKRWLTISLLALAGAAIGAGGWFGTDRLEQDNDFCNACHLDGWTSGTPLHEEHRADFDGRPARSLAAAHAAAGNDARAADPAFRCIDCHGGVGLHGRARVKLLAAKDAFFWLVGDFDEPEGMAWPLLEEDCRQCHSVFASKAAPFEDPAFHDLAVHNAELGVDCVECHQSHGQQVDPERWFLDTALVREQCARCHREMAGP